MKKDLPQIKKGLKSFILDEDAKIIDKTATKIALTSSFIAFSLIANSDDVVAWKHKDHDNHSNNLNAPMNYGTDYHAGVNPTQVIINKLEPKGVDTYHSNHYNHGDGSYDIFKPKTWGYLFGSQTGAVSLMSRAQGNIITSEIADSIDKFKDPSNYEIDTGVDYIIPEEIILLLKEEENN